MNIRIVRARGDDSEGHSGLKWRVGAFAAIINYDSLVTYRSAASSLHLQIKCAVPQVVDGTPNTPCVRIAQVLNDASWVKANWCGTVRENEAKEIDHARVVSYEIDDIGKKEDKP